MHTPAPLYVVNQGPDYTAVRASSCRTALCSAARSAPTTALHSRTVLAAPLWLSARRPITGAIIIRYVLRPAAYYGLSCTHHYLARLSRRPYFAARS